MIHPFFERSERSRALVFAHRGGSGLAPENTLAAFDHAVALGVDGIELDVRLSRDGIVVVHHDRALTRTTNLKGNVDEHLAQELVNANAAAHFWPAAPGPSVQEYSGRTGVPRLDTVLARFPDQRIIIELKLNDRSLADAVLDVVRATNADDRVCLGSFGLRALRAARRRAPHVATSAAREEVRWALYRSWVHWPVSRVGYSGYQIPELAGRTRVVSPRFVNDAHAAGLGVQVWTVDDAAEALRLLDWGVDAVITDRPDVILPVVMAAPASTR